MDDPRTAARDAAYAFISEPNKADKIDKVLALVGMINMVFPRVEIDWNSVGMIAEAVAKMEGDDKIGSVL